MVQARKPLLCAEHEKIEITLLVGQLLEKLYQTQSSFDELSQLNFNHRLPLYDRPILQVKSADNRLNNLLSSTEVREIRKLSS